MTKIAGLLYTAHFFSHLNHCAATADNLSLIQNQNTDSTVNSNTNTCNSKSLKSMANNSLNQPILINHVRENENRHRDNSVNSNTENMTLQSKSSRDLSENQSQSHSHNNSNNNNNNIPSSHSTLGPHSQQNNHENENVMIQNQSRNEMDSGLVESTRLETSLEGAAYPHFTSSDNNLATSGMDSSLTEALGNLNLSGPQNLSHSQNLYSANAATSMFNESSTGKNLNWVGS